MSDEAQTERAREKKRDPLPWRQQYQACLISVTSRTPKACFSLFDEQKDEPSPLCFDVERPDSRGQLGASSHLLVARSSKYYRGQNNYLYYIAGCLSYLLYNGPQIPILIIEAPIVWHFVALQLTTAPSISPCLSLLQALAPFAVFHFATGVFFYAVFEKLYYFYVPEACPVGLLCWASMGGWGPEFDETTNRSNVRLTAIWGS